MTTRAGDLHSQFYDAIMRGDLDEVDRIEKIMDDMIERKKGNPVPDRHPLGRTIARKKDPFATPLWFKILMAFALLLCLAILGLMAWAVVEIVPPVVHWLDRH